MAAYHFYLSPAESGGRGEDNPTDFKSIWGSWGAEFRTALTPAFIHCWTTYYSICSQRYVILCSILPALIYWTKPHIFILFCCIKSSLEYFPSQTRAARILKDFFRVFYNGNLLHCLWGIFLISGYLTRHSVHPTVLLLNKLYFRYNRRGEKKRQTQVKEMVQNIGGKWDCSHLLYSWTNL